MLNTPEEKLVYALSTLKGSQETLLASLKTLVEQATNQDLVNAINGHTEVTQQQIVNIDHVLELLGQEPSVRPSAASSGLALDGITFVNECATPALKDCAIADVVLKAEAFESACQIGIAHGLLALDKTEAVGFIIEGINQNEEMQGAITFIMSQLADVVK